MNFLIVLKFIVSVSEKVLIF